MRRGGAGRGRARGVVTGLLLLTAALGGADPQKPPEAVPGKAPPATPPAAKPLPRDATEKAQAHYELGVIYHERLFEHLDKAIEEYQAALKLKPDHAEAH